MVNEPLPPNARLPDGFWTVIALPEAKDETFPLFINDAVVNVTGPVALIVPLTRATPLGETVAALPID